MAARRKKDTVENGTGGVNEAAGATNLMETGEFLTRDQILGAQDRVQEEVFISEWNGKVMVKGLTGVERDKLEASMVQGRGPNRQVNLANLRAKLVALSVIDKKGNRVFSDDDARILGQRSAAALDKIYGVAQRLSGITKEDAEELAKNSESDQSDGSTLD